MKKVFLAAVVALGSLSSSVFAGEGVVTRTGEGVVTRIGEGVVTIEGVVTRIGEGVVTFITAILG